MDSIPAEALNATAVDVADAAVAAAAFNCDKRVARLSKSDCTYLKSKGFTDQGVNAVKAAGKAWIGNDGPYTFKFTNQASKPAVGVILVLWLMNGEKDYGASFVNARRPRITVSLPKPGDSVVISVAANQIGGWAAITGHATGLSRFGQVSNTWGEFNTKKNGNTFDVSREVNMKGNGMHIRAGNGCVADMGTCVFKCVNGANSCGNAGEYKIFNCQAPNPGAQHANDGANGGCSGWGNSGRGHLDVDLKH